MNIPIKFYTIIKKQSRVYYFLISNMLIILFLLLILLLVLFFFGSKLGIEIFSYPVLISIFMITLLSLLSFTLPLFSFLFTIFISSFLMFMSLPFTFIRSFQKRLLSKTLLFLYKRCFLDFLAVIHIKFFSATTQFILYLRFFIIFSINLIHIILSRWYFFQKTFLERDFSYEMQIIIIICIFVGVAVSYLRFLLTFSQFIIPLTLQTNPTLLSSSVLYVLGENPEDFPKATNASDIPAKRFSLININAYRNYYHQYYSHSGNSSFKYASFCIGFCAMGAAFATAIYAKDQTEYSRQQTEYSRQQTEYSRQQTEYSKQQAYDTGREADAAAVDSGLLAKEEYWRRHPQDALHKPKN